MSLGVRGFGFAGLLRLWLCLLPSAGGGLSARIGMTIICRPPLLKRSGVRGSMISIWLSPNFSALVRKSRFM